MTDSLDLTGVVLRADGLPFVVAVTGEKRHGKDTFAKAWNEITGGGIVRIADGFKSMLRGYYQHVGLTPEEIEARIEGDLKDLPDDHLGGKSPRDAMLVFGTDCREKIWPKLWVAPAAREAVRRIGRLESTVIPDMRVPDPEEVEMDRIGAFKVKVVDPRRVKDSGSGHVTETGTALIQPHVTLINDGTLEEFEMKVALLALALHASRLST